jgi:hypothetical protein
MALDETARILVLAVRPDVYTPLVRVLGFVRAYLFLRRMRESSCGDARFPICIQARKCYRAIGGESDKFGWRRFRTRWDNNVCMLQSYYSTEQIRTLR